MTTITTGVVPAQAALAVAAADSAVPKSEAPPPLYAADFASRGSALALGLAPPRNSEDVEMLFAQVSTEASASQTEAKGEALADKLEQQATLLKELEGRVDAADQGGFLGFLLSIVSFFFSAVLGIDLQIGNAQADGAAVSGAQSKATGAAVDGNADFSEGQVANDLAQDIANRELSPEEGNPRNVADRANGFAYSVALADFSLMQVLSSSAPLNGGADGPQAALDGRLKLAV